MNSWYQSVYTDTNNGVAAMSMSAIMATYVDTSDVNDGNLFIFTNREVLNVLRDPAVIQGSPVIVNPASQVWVRPLGGPATGTNAVLFVNLSSSPQPVSVGWPNLPGVAAGATVTVRDLWAQSSVYTGTGPAWTNTVPANSVRLFKVSLLPNTSVQVTNLTGGLTTNYTVPGGATFYITNGVIMKLQ
jgi:hypothetical protein